MASCLVYISRFLFFVSVSLQAYSLASYPAKYKHKDSFYGLLSRFCSAIALRLYVIFDHKNLRVTSLVS